MRSLGTLAMIAALAGFAVFFTTVNASYGISGIALAAGFGVLLMLVTARPRVPAQDGAPRPVTAPVASPAARGWTLAAIFALLVLGAFTLRYMYWL